MESIEGIKNTDGVLQEKLELALEEYLEIKGFNKPVFSLTEAVAPIQGYDGVEVINLVFSWIVRD